MKAKLGSGDARLCAQVAAELEDEAEEIDELAQEAAEDRDVEPLTLRDALSHLIMGTDREAQLGFVYGYAFAFLCQHLGETLDNAHWSALASSSNFGTQVDAALAYRGVDETLSVSMLLARGAPLQLPPIDDFPSFGYLSNVEVQRALAVLDPAQLASVTDRRTRDALSELRGWLVHCAAAGQDLLCFYC
ncbi:MAG TPA: hypothetical protein VNG33_22065 [Polyangiaceae bacterium]|nr:hypothetical protein [Polyangiaceae bacterium]